jgi:hypothetical protein
MRYASVAAVLALGLGALALSLPNGAPGQAPAVNSSASAATSQEPFSVSGKKDPELDKLVAAEAEAAREVARLVADYKGTEDDGERAKLKAKLSAALTKQFEQQQKRRELELARAEEQLKKLRELMKKRGEEKKTIVDKRLDQVVREAEGLGWSAPPGPGPRPQAGNNLGLASPASRK